MLAPRVIFLHPLTTTPSPFIDAISSARPQTLVGYDRQVFSRYSRGSTPATNEEKISLLWVAGDLSPSGSFPERDDVPTYYRQFTLAGHTVHIKHRDFSPSLADIFPLSVYFTGFF